jgi:hypothetical protein
VTEDAKHALEHAILLAEAAFAAGTDCETWHLRSDELWLFVLIYIRDHSTDPEAQRLANVALGPRSDTGGWYA